MRKEICKKMKVWVVRDLEPLSTDAGAPRLMRAGILCKKLAEKGHETIWFTSSFNHYTREQRASGRFHIQDNLTVNIIKAPGYSENISFSRLLHNIKFARVLQKQLSAEVGLPDVIVADLPTTEAASVAVKFGIKMNIPTIVTIRDLWPDFFADYLPIRLRWIAHCGVYPLKKQAAFACKYATSLVGISDEYLKWGQRKGRGETSLDGVFPLGYSPISINDDVISSDIIELINVKKDKKIVSFVGSWGKSYDIRLLAETAKKLLRRTDILFVIAGDSSSQPKLAEELKELPNVILTGWLNRYQVASLLRCSTIGLLPYKPNAPQGLPNKIFEYMAYGVFQISTLGGEAKEVLEELDVGVSIPSGSVIEMSRQIEYYLKVFSDDQQRKYITKVFEERYSSDVVYNNYIKHLEFVINSQKLMGC